jgi:release factor glutamine methyltransferase
MDTAATEHLDRPVTGRTDFGGLTVEWDERLQRPRPWALQLALWAAELLSSVPPGPVLELCSGAGHVGLRALMGSARRLVCVDADPVAASYVAKNATAAGMGRQTEIRLGGIESVLLPQERFPLVIAHPPAAPTQHTDRFPGAPLRVIDAGSDGIDIVRICVIALELHLAIGGVALVQLGSPTQAAQVAELVSGGRLAAVETRELARGVVLRLDADHV